MHGDGGCTDAQAPSLEMEGVRLVQTHQVLSGTTVDIYMIASVKSHGIQVLALFALDITSFMKGLQLRRYPWTANGCIRLFGYS
jgi:hypothetical protein